MSSSLFVGIDRVIMDGFTSQLSGLSSGYGPMLGDIIKGGIALYVVFSGYKALAGKLDNSFAEVVWELARLAIIWTFVSNAGGWYDTVVAAINGVRDGFSGDAGGIWGLLDSVWDKTQVVATNLYDLDGDTFAIRGALSEAVVWGGAGFMMLVAAAVNLAAEIMLMILLAVGPLFIACLMFGWFKGMFDSWMKEIISCLFTVLFSALGIQVALRIYDLVINAAESASADSNIMTLAFECAGGAVMAGVIVKLSSQMAGSLASATAQAAAQGMAKAGLSLAGAAAGTAAKKAGSTIANGLGKGAGYLGGKAANAISGYMNTRQLSKMAVENMKRASSQSNRLK